jgi:hypothetical protein
MASLVLTGDTSGQVTIAAPAVAGTTTLTLPATTGTVLNDATVGVCRAWVNFNGTGTVAIRASFNVSSITDNGTGDYTVNFTTAISDANYAPTFMIRNSVTARFETAVIRGDVAPTTTSLRFVTGISTFGVDNYLQDVPLVAIAIFR